MVDSGTAEADIHVVCPHCGSTNRIAAGRSAKLGKCGRCHRPLFEGAPTDVRAEAFRRHLQGNDIPVLVDFWAEWCGPCEAMAPVFAALARETEPGARFLRVDTEKEPQLAAQHGIRGIPTMILFRGGRPVAHQVGAMGTRELRSWIGQHIS